MQSDKISGRKEPMIIVDHQSQADCKGNERCSDNVIGCGLGGNLDASKVHKYSPTAASDPTKSSSHYNGTESFGSCSRQMSGIENFSGSHNFSFACERVSNNLQARDFGSS